MLIIHLVFLAEFFFHTKVKKTNTEPCIKSLNLKYINENCYEFLTSKKFTNLEKIRSKF